MQDCFSFVVVVVVDVVDVVCKKNFVVSFFTSCLVVRGIFVCFFVCLLLLLF